MEKIMCSSKKKEDCEAIPSMDKLREELTCSICLQICFEPSTTQCGHSFCKNCLRSAVDKCGKRCPKCRQRISHGRSCTVNTVLWNTIQLLFPKEIEARKLSGTVDSQESKRQLLATHNRYQSVRSLNDGLETEPESSATRSNQNLRNRGVRPSVVILTRRVNEDARNRVRGREHLAIQNEFPATQNEVAALARETMEAWPLIEQRAAPRQHINSSTRNRDQSVCPLNNDLETEPESSASRSYQNLRNRGVRPSVVILTRRVNEDARNSVRGREHLAIQNEVAATQNEVAVLAREIMEAWPLIEQRAAPRQQRNSSIRLPRAIASRGQEP